jgi:hypothetical protein
MVYRDSNGQGNFRRATLLHADDLALADNLSLDPNLFFRRGNLKPQI